MFGKQHSNTRNRNPEVTKFLHMIYNKAKPVTASVLHSTYSLASGGSGAETRKNSSDSNLMDKIGSITFAGRYVTEVHRECPFEVSKRFVGAQLVFGIDAKPNVQGFLSSLYGTRILKNLLLVIMPSSHVAPEHFMHGYMITGERHLGVTSLSAAEKALILNAQQPNTYSIIYCSVCVNLNDVIKNTVRTRIFYVLKLRPTGSYCFKYKNTEISLNYVHWRTANPSDLACPGKCNYKIRRVASSARDKMRNRVNADGNDLRSKRDKTQHHAKAGFLNDVIKNTVRTRIFYVLKLRPTGSYCFKYKNTEISLNYVHWRTANPSDLACPGKCNYKIRRVASSARDKMRNRVNADGNDLRSKRDKTQHHAKAGFPAERSSMHVWCMTQYRPSYFGLPTSANSSKRKESARQGDRSDKLNLPGVGLFRLRLRGYYAMKKLSRQRIRNKLYPSSRQRIRNKLYPSLKEGYRCLACRDPSGPEMNKNWLRGSATSRFYMDNPDLTLEGREITNSLSTNMPSRLPRAPSVSGTQGARSKQGAIESIDNLISNSYQAGHPDICSTRGIWQVGDGRPQIEIPQLGLEDTDAGPILASGKVDNKANGDVVSKKKKELLLMRERQWDGFSGVNSEPRAICNLRGTPSKRTFEKLGKLIQQINSQTIPHNRYLMGFFKIVEMLDVKIYARLETYWVGAAPTLDPRCRLDCFISDNHKDYVLSVWLLCKQLNIFLKLMPGLEKNIQHIDNTLQLRMSRRLRVS